MNKIAILIIIFILSTPLVALGEERAGGVEDLVTPRLVVQLGHSDFVNSVAISSNNMYVLSGSRDQTMKLWDISTGAEIRTFTGHSDAVASVAFSPDGKYALSGSVDKTLRLWDIATGNEIRRFEGHSYWVYSVAFSPDGRYALSGSWDGNICLWDIATGKKVHKFEGQKSAVMSVAFSPDGKYILSGSVKNLYLWDIATGKGREIRKSEGASGAFYSVAFSPEGKYILFGSDDTTLRLLDIVTAKEIRKFEGHFEVVTSVAFSPDGRYALSGSWDRTIYLWEVATGKKVRKFEGHKGWVKSVAFSPDSKHIVSGSDDHTLRLWDIDTAKEIRRFEGNSSQIESVTFSSDISYILSGDKDNTLHLWDIATGKKVQKFEGHKGWVKSVAFSPDSKRILSGSDDHTLRLWDIDTSKEIQRFEGHSTTVESVAFSPDSRYALSGGVDAARLWDIATGKEIRKFSGSTFSTSAAFISDGKYVTAGSGASIVHVWEISTGKEISKFGYPMYFDPEKNKPENSNSSSRTVKVHPSDKWYALSFSADGMYALSGIYDNCVFLWDMSTGKEICQYKGHSAWVISSTFSPNSRFALSGSGDKTLKLWEIATCKEIRTLVGHSGPVTSVAYSPDGRYALSGSDDKTMMLWDISTGKWLVKLISFNDGTWAVVDPEGRFDTNNLEEIKGLRWIMPDDPLTPLPLETFMKDYYEPRLLPRILNPDSGDKLEPVKDLMKLNRVLPSVTISSVTREGKGDTVSVKVEVAKQSRLIGKKMVNTGVKDLKLFRDGQLVGFKEGSISLEEDGTQRITFSGIRLPRNGSKEVEFTAYAFNDDNIKSLNARTSFAMPSDITHIKGKAYIVSIGINKYEDSNVKQLRYSVNDAMSIRDSLTAQIPQAAEYTEIIPMMLTDENATRENIEGIFSLLSGESISPSVKTRIPNAERITKATPEDMLIISFSGHGINRSGAFYLYPHDTGSNTVENPTEEQLSRLISSEDLSRWLRHVDAGQMAMIIDACNSAASVKGKGFKPGPMESRGLGQLAYDKGMKILAASQSDQSAGAHGKLGMGFLTYALVQDGLREFKADYKPKDKQITLGEWLSYGVEQVPQLYTKLTNGEIKGPEKKISRYQQPALFDFMRRQKTDVSIAKEN